MKVSPPQFREVGADRRRIAFRRRAPTRASEPGVVWLGGYKSDMDSTKASVLDAHCETTGRAFLRFDYSGHGLSDGDFEAGTVTRWLEEARELIAGETEGPQILVGSSMGGYLALLVAREFRTPAGLDEFAVLAVVADSHDVFEHIRQTACDRDFVDWVLDNAIFDPKSEYTSGIIAGCDIHTWAHEFGDQESFIHFFE